jgi:hypothetical protein
MWIKAAKPVEKTGQVTSQTQKKKRSTQQPVEGEKE